MFCSSECERQHGLTHAVCPYVVFVHEAPAGLVDGWFETETDQSP